MKAVATVLLIGVLVMAGCSERNSSRGVGRNQLWPRLWETFGEDPYLVSMMGEAYVKGIEGDHNNIGNVDKAAACIKH